jgi:hypothetical protein
VSLVKKSRLYAFLLEDVEGEIFGIKTISLIRNVVLACDPVLNRGMWLKSCLGSHARSKQKILHPLNSASNVSNRINLSSKFPFRPLDTFSSSAGFVYSQLRKRFFHPSALFSKSECSSPRLRTTISLR